VILLSMIFQDVVENKKLLKIVQKMLIKFQSPIW